MDIIQLVAGINGPKKIKELQPRLLQGTKKMYRACSQNRYNFNKRYIAIIEFGQI